MGMKHYADLNGAYIGGFVDGAVPPPEAVEVSAPPDARANWTGKEWITPSLAPTREQQEAARQAAYSAEADPIAMQMLRDEATKEEWLAKIDEIKARYPYPEETTQ